jgi:hypothetical protein
MSKVASMLRRGALHERSSFLPSLIGANTSSISQVSQTMGHHWYQEYGCLQRPPTSTLVTLVSVCH